MVALYSGGSYPPATSVKQPPISTPRVARCRNGSGLTRNARLSEARAKVVCCKAGDPWASLNYQDPFFQHTRRHPRQTGGSCFIGNFTPFTTEGKWSVNFIPHRQREKRNIWEKIRLWRCRNRRSIFNIELLV